MCLIGLAIDVDRRFPLVVAANRDEFFDRPASRLAWWSPGAGQPDALSGAEPTDRFWMRTALMGENEPVSETELHQEAVADATVKRTRVRSLLKPEPKRRRRS